MKRIKYCCQNKLNVRKLFYLKRKVQLRTSGDFDVRCGYDKYTTQIEFRFNQTYNWTES